MLPVPILEIEDKSDYIKCDSTGNDADDDAEREERADYNPQRRKEMDPIDTTVTIADWLSNSYLRSVVITCFIVGGAVGFLLSKYAFAFCRWYTEWKRKTKQEDEAEQRRAAEEERNRLFPVFGVYWNRDLQPFCPVCKTPLAPFYNYDGHKFPGSVCKKCKIDISLRSEYLTDIDSCLAEVDEYIKKNG